MREPFQRGPFAPPAFDLNIEEMTHMERYTRAYYEQEWYVRFALGLVGHRMRFMSCALRLRPSDGVWEVDNVVTYG